MKNIFKFLKNIYTYEDLFNIPEIYTFDNINFLDSYSKEEYESKILRHLLHD